MVDAFSIGSLWGPAKGEVPLEEVGFEGPGSIVGGGRIGQLGSFLHFRLLVCPLDGKRGAGRTYALDGGILGSGSWRRGHGWRGTVTTLTRAVACDKVGVIGRWLRIRSVRLTGFRESLCEEWPGAVDV